jgi:hypothetical protein
MGKKPLSANEPAYALLNVVEHFNHVTLGLQWKWPFKIKGYILGQS